MAITVCPVTANFAAEIGDVDLSRPLDSADVASIKQAFWDYAVLIFPGQELSEEQHLDFARHFGPLETKHRGFEPGRETAAVKQTSRRFQSQLAERNLGRKEPGAHVAARQSAVAHGKFVQISAGGALFLC